MGSRLTVLAASLLISVATAHADKASDATALMKQGLDAYKAKDYAKAATALESAYKLDPRPDILFAWAQAKRLDGDCKSAAKLYKKLLDASPDLSVAKLIRENLLLCEKDEPEKEPEPPKQPPAPPPPPPAKTTVIEHRGASSIAIVLVAAGTAALGVGGGFYVASRSTAEDATAARTYDEYLAQRDRAERQSKTALISSIAGGTVLAGGIAVWLATRGTRRHEVTVTPTDGGGAVSLSGRW